MKFQNNQTDGRIHTRPDQTNMAPDFNDVGGGGGITTKYDVMGNY